MEEFFMFNETGENLYLPPGFRFHPLDEEIITFYLSQKVIDPSFAALAVGEADLNKCEPWDLPSKAKMGENEWYFFCKKDRKYQTGFRTNRATDSGYWKATGKDKKIFNGGKTLIGMKKTLVFYKGRAPNGEKTDWVMHEFRLEGSSLNLYHQTSIQKEEWVVCKIIHKNIGLIKRESNVGAVTSVNSNYRNPDAISTSSNAQTALDRIDLNHLWCNNNTSSEIKEPGFMISNHDAYGGCITGFTDVVDNNLWNF
ncbi:hypothetical protein LUZ60_011077 [Juncus effusus]|nr:hypothetical protein LUZ60_011077 [Juncus effusus]